MPPSGQDAGASPSNTPGLSLGPFESSPLSGPPAMRGLVGVPPAHILNGTDAQATHGHESGREQRHPADFRRARQRPLGHIPVRLLEESRFQPPPLDPSPRNSQRRRGWPP